MGFKEKFFGEGEGYNYAALCMPQMPWKKDQQKLVFYGVDEPLPYLVALLMGLQHAFTMVGNVITPPFVIFRFSVAPDDPELQGYAIAAALIVSGICTLIQVSKIPIPGTKSLFGRQMYLGSGILGVMGTSIAFLPIYEVAINQQINNGIEPIIAYGNMLGNTLICGLLEVFLSSLPPKKLRKVFPPVVTCVTVILIGVTLSGVGMKYWGGGAVCADMIWKDHVQAVAAGVEGSPTQYCTNGNVKLPYGSPEFIGLGFSVMCMLIFIEFFGSIFMKNCNVIIALLFGYLVAGLTNYEGESYISAAKVENAPWITFLFVKVFPIGFYGPALIPLFIAFYVTTLETAGDITAVYDASYLDVGSERYTESLQGGLLSDGFCSIFSALLTSMPNTTLSQNNGVVAMTKCASTRAGYACGFWLIFMGVLAKISGVITSIPDCVLGGMTTFLFCNVLVSGISLSSQLDMNSRRVKFILAVSLALGVGVTVWPFAFKDMRGSPYTANFWPCANCSETMQGLRNGVVVILSTGYAIGSMTAMFLNALLPADPGMIGMETPKKAVEDSPAEQASVIEEDP